MSVRLDELTIANRDGQSFLEVVDGQTSYLVWRTEFQAAAITLSSPQVILRRSDSESVTLASVTASSGEVSATVTSSELTTASAQLGDDLIAELTGTYTSGSDAYLVRHRSAVIVVSRATRAVVMYDEITTRYPQLAESCALPTGQTTFHPQMRIGLRDWRREMDLRFGRTNVIVLPDQLAALQVCYVLIAVCQWQHGNTMGSGDYWAGQVRDWREERDRLWKRLEVVVEDGVKAWGKRPNGEVRRAESDGYRTPRADGPPSYGGSM